VKFQLSTLFILLLCGPVQAGTLLVVNKSAASVTFFDEADYANVAVVAVGQGPHEIAVSPAGELAAVSNYGSRGKAGASLSLVDIAAATVLRTIDLPKGARPHGIEWLDGRRVAVTAEGLDSLLVVDTETGAVTAQISVDQSVAHMVAVGPNASLAFTANIGSGTVSVLSLSEGQKLRDLPAGEGTEGIALVGDRELWVSNRQDGSVQIFDRQTLERRERLMLGGFPIRVEADEPRGRVYVTQAVTDSLAVIDRNTRELLQRVDFAALPELRRGGDSMLGSLSDGSIPVGVLLAGDGRRLYVAHTQADAVSVIDAETMELLRVVQAGDEPDGMGWSPQTLLSRDTSAVDP
jgi:YVTN family beta-propeller protein